MIVVCDVKRLQSERMVETEKKSRDAKGRSHCQIVLHILWHSNPAASPSFTSKSSHHRSSSSCLIGVLITIARRETLSSSSAISSAFSASCEFAIITSAFPPHAPSLEHGTQERQRHRLCSCQAYRHFLHHFEPYECNIYTCCHFRSRGTSEHDRCSTRPGTCKEARQVYVEDHTYGNS